MSHYPTARTGNDLEGRARNGGGENGWTWVNLVLSTGWTGCRGCEERIERNEDGQHGWGGAGKNQEFYFDQVLFKMLLDIYGDIIH